MKLQRQIAKNRVVLALSVALLMAANAWGVNEYVTFINDQGKLTTAGCAVIDADYLSNYATTLPYVCHVVKGNLVTDKRIWSSNIISLIIADGASLTINFNSQKTDEHAFHSKENIRIFGQTEQTGALIINETGSSYGRGLSADGSIKIFGGNVTVTSNARDAIWANGDIDIYGGYISATSNATGYDGIESETGNININWVNSLYASSYSTPLGAVNFTNGLSLKGDNGTNYSGSNPSIAGKTLTPTDYLVHFVTNGNGSKRAIINGEYKGTASVTDIAAQSNVVTIDYNRTFTAGVPATVVLPFSLPEGATTNAKFYRLKQVVQVDGACAWNASAQNIATDPAENAIKRPQANEPYIVMLNEGNKLEFYLSSSSVTFNPSNNPTTTVSDGKWNFIGVYSFKEWRENDGLAYAFAGSNENIKQGKFGKIAIAKDAATTGYPYANPFRAYLKKKDNTVKLQCPQAVLGQNSAQYSLGHNTETIDVQFIDEDENGEKTTFMARMNTRTGEFTMLPNYDAKGRKIAAPKVRGAYYGKKVLKN